VRDFARNNLIGLLALFISLSGVAWAAGNLPKKSVGPKQLKARAVTNPKLAPGAVTGDKVRDRSLSVSDVAGLPTSLPPSGGAGGALAGSYPSPTLADGAVTPSKLGTIPAAEGAPTASIDVPNNVVTQLTLGTELFDTVGMLNPGTSTFTIPITGTYLLAGKVRWAGAAAGQIQVNVLQNGGVLMFAVTAPTDQGFDQVLLKLARLEAGDTISATVFQNSGGLLPINAAPGGTETYLGLSWLGP